MHPEFYPSPPYQLFAPDPQTSLRTGQGLNRGNEVSALGTMEPPNWVALDPREMGVHSLIESWGSALLSNCGYSPESTAAPE